MNSVKNLLLIDDDEIFTFMTKKIIERTNLAEQIKIFENGKDAITFLESVAHKTALLPEIIFLDISMPILDGWGFLEEYIQLKPKFGKKITLYIISSSVSPRDHERAKTYSDVSDFIIKPMSKEKFIDIIKNL
ncbi:response regulator [Flavobacterium sp.]|uniref:response regulator n=1 Tax=Flavobacterium sp. TaxID=239 RepID=UPI002FDAA693